MEVLERLAHYPAVQEKLFACSLSGNSTVRLLLEVLHLPKRQDDEATTAVRFL